jgi:hypothetical protein
MKLIDKAAVVAEIERRLQEYRTYPDYQIDSNYMELCDILSFLDTLEVKDMNEVPANVMLNQYDNKYISSWSGLKEYNNFQLNEEIRILIPNK